MKCYVIDKEEFTPTGDWSVSNALHMMKLCYAVYAGTTDDIGSSEDWKITQQLVQDAGYEMLKIEASLGIYDPNAMICWDEETVFLIFRGTEPTSLKQWATDLDLSRIPLEIDGQEVGTSHSGFSSSVDLIWGEVVAGLGKADPLKDKQLFVGGHSLGAGMSQIASCRLLAASSDWRPTAVYNFGCPRALDRSGASFYDESMQSNTFRVVNNNDVVCNVPLAIEGFRHVGQLKYITAKIELLDSLPPAQLLKEAIMGGAQALSELNFLDIVIDHLPENYTNNLDQLNIKESGKSSRESNCTD